MRIEPPGSYAVGNLTNVRKIRYEKNVIERLRESQNKRDSDMFNGGRETGIEWAKQYAEAIELRRLGEAWDIRSGNEHDWLSDCGDAYENADRFVWAIRPEDQSRVGRPFFESEILGDNDDEFHLIDEPEFIHGFARGVLDVWDEVKGQL